MRRLLVNKLLNMNNVAKTVVNQTIKEQKKVSINRSSIVVYGFPEENKDRQELLSMFKFLDCRCEIIRLIRISRTMESVRLPLKLVLKSPSDVNFVLSNAKHLRQDKCYSGIYLSKWLFKEEFDNIKLLRQECEDLNKANQDKVNSRRLFVIVSGRIMQRNAYGKLQPYKEQPSKKAPPTSQDVIGS